MKIEGTNITMTRGDNETLTVSCPDLPFSPGDVVDITIRKSSCSGSVVIHKTATEFADRKAVFVFEPEDTSGLPCGKYKYDVQATYTTVGVKTIIKPATFTLGEECTYE